jgi:YgiT-type zinc finger domain-containing protein
MSTPLTTRPCLNCQGGRKNLCSVTYMTWVGNDLITVPNFPAWICDICGERTYDTRAMAQLTMLLNAETGTPVQPGLQCIENNPPANTPPA